MSLKSTYLSAKTIHSKIHIVDGKKIFPPAIAPVTTIYKELFVSTNTIPTVSIVIPSYYRQEVLALTLKALLSNETTIPFEIIVYDNSFHQEVFQRICTEIRQQLAESPSNPAVTKVTVYHDATPNFPQLRNIAIDNLCDANASVIGFWDSDMIAQKGTVQGLAECLIVHPDLYGIAPAMVGIADSNNIKSDISLIDQQQFFQMPGSIGMSLGTLYNEHILLTGILRGCFFLKRSALTKHKATFHQYFPKQFTVWSNVAFFIGLRELGLKYGYLLDTTTYVVNNDTETSFTLGRDLNHRILENLKSILMLIVRNRLFLPHFRIIQNKFEKYTRAHIASICNMPPEQSEHLFDELLAYAQSICEQMPLTLHHPLIKKLQKHIQLTVTDLQEICSFQSINPHIPIYDTSYTTPKNTYFE